LAAIWSAVFGDNFADVPQMPTRATPTIANAGRNHQPCFIESHWFRCIA